MEKIEKDGKMYWMCPSCRRHLERLEKTKRSVVEWIVRYQSWREDDESWEVCCPHCHYELSDEEITEIDLE